MIVINNIPKLIETAQKFEDEPTARQVINLIHRQASPVMQKLLEEGAPSGERWTEPLQGRPSVRLGYGILAAGWNEPVISLEGREASVIFSSKADHMEWVLHGAPRHDEPKTKSGPMKFFWFKKGHFVKLYEVDHPGIEPNPFPDRAFEPRGKQAYLGAMRQHAILIFTPLRELFSG